MGKRMAWEVKFVLVTVIAVVLATAIVTVLFVGLARREQSTKEVPHAR